MIRICASAIKAATNVIALSTILLLVSFDAGASGPDAVSGARELPASTLRSGISGTDPVNGGYIMQLILGLIIVLFCIVALAWLARRFNRLQATPDGSLRVLGGMSMGARERIVLVQVGAKQLLLGVAPGQISTLHVLDEPLESVATTTDQSRVSGFAEKLNSVIARNARR